MVVYPDNDETAAILAAALNGDFLDYTEDKVYHQVVPIKKGGFGIDMHGHTLQMYGGPPGAAPVEVYGKLVTGPAAWFLDGAGNPIGYPGSESQHTAQFNAFQCVGDGIDGVTLSMVHDDNIQQESDAMCGATFLPTKLDTDIVVEDFEIINNYGGQNYYPDPVHLESPDMVVSNYKAGLKTAVPTDLSIHGGVPGGLIAAGGKNPVSGLDVKNVEIVGFYEIDGILVDGNFVNVKGTHILVGNSVPAGSWGGTLWKKFAFSWPATSGPVLNFNNGLATDWTVEDSVFDGDIDGAANFGGTWATSNTPPTLPTS